MARNIFFSFFYQRDIWRVNQVRQSWRFISGNDTQPFYDRSLWEEEQQKGEAAIQKLIDEGLRNTSATVVLVGALTAGRKWIDYEIKKSYNDRKGLVAVRIHHLKNKDGYIDSAGTNPFDSWHIELDGQKRYFSELFKTYTWDSSTGGQDLALWVEEAIALRNVL